MGFDFGTFNGWGRLREAALRRPEAAFVSAAKIATEWSALHYRSAPDLARAIEEFAALERIFAAAGTRIVELPAADELTLDSLYAYDSLIVTPRGLVRPRMGKAVRRREPAVNGAFLESLGHPMAGEIVAPGLLEGGDLVWLDPRTLLAGVGYRSNLEGVRQLGELIGPGVEILAFDTPHYRGPADVFHLMSVFSPLDRDLAVVYLPLIPARLVQVLEDRGFDLVEVPDEEFATMGGNVLALGPRHALMIEGNPETARRLRAAGVRVEEFAGAELCRKGEGGPTCMTLPLRRG